MRVVPVEHGMRVLHRAEVAVPDISVEDTLVLKQTAHIIRRAHVPVRDRHARRRAPVDDVAPVASPPRQLASAIANISDQYVMNGDIYLLTELHAARVPSARVVPTTHASAGIVLSLVSENRRDSRFDAFSFFARRARAPASSAS